jgi:hypothetical protein
MMTTIPLAILTSVYALADKKGGNGNQELNQQEWDNFFASANLITEAKDTSRVGNLDSIPTLGYSSTGAPDMRTRIKNNFKNSGGFTAFEQAIVQLEKDRDMRNSLFAYGLQVQKERHEAGFGKISFADQSNFNVINIADGISKSAKINGNNVVGVTYNSKKGTWAPSVGPGEARGSNPAPSTGPGEARGSNPAPSPGSGKKKTQPPANPSQLKPDTSVNPIQPKAKPKVQATLVNDPT